MYIQTHTHTPHTHTTHTHSHTHTHTHTHTYTHTHTLHTDYIPGVASDVGRIVFLTVGPGLDVQLLVATWQVPAHINHTH